MADSSATNNPDGPICVLCGGVGAARFLKGLIRVVDPADIVAIVNTADDMVLHGLAISPDLDTCTYTLADAINTETGWGLSGETWQAMDTLGRYGGQTWFGLGDRDLGTHLFRTQRRAEGATLSEITKEITAAWQLELAMLPMTNDVVRTKVTIDSGEVLDFQRYFVERHHQDTVTSVSFEGAADAQPAPGVIDALQSARAIIIAPSNPIVSIGPILAIPGIRERLVAQRSVSAAISPIIGGAALKGPAADLLRSLGHEVSAVGVARIYAELATHLLIDTADVEREADIRDAGMIPHALNTIMSTPAITDQLATVALDVCART